MTVRLIIEATSKVVELETPSGIVPARVWEGRTDDGEVTGIQVFVTRLAVPLENEQSRFTVALQETRAPSAASQAIPHRLVL